MHYETKEDNSIICQLCAHHCTIAPGDFGLCGLRQNQEGRLYTYVYGEPIAAHLDPIEKKPLYHFLPGTLSYSIATIGCNFKCRFCQNWQISQISYKESRPNDIPRILPEEIVEQALHYNARSISYTYTEPTIFFEYAYEIAKLAKEKGLYNIFVTNGYMTPQALEKIRPYLDACNVDLKSFQDDFYRKNCQARLQPVLDNIRLIKTMGIWMEVTTLIIPNENDSSKELNQMAAFIAQVDPDIPWHLSRFHPDYKFMDHGATDIKTLHEAQKIAHKHNLKYVYLGNVPESADTYCPNCNQVLIKRSYFNTSKINIRNGQCPHCQMPIPGLWI